VRGWPCWEDPDPVRRASQERLIARIRAADGPGVQET